MQKNSHHAYRKLFKIVFLLSVLLNTLGTLRAAATPAGGRRAGSKPLRALIIDETTGAQILNTSPPRRKQNKVAPTAHARYIKANSLPVTRTAHFSTLDHPGGTGSTRSAWSTSSVTDHDKSPASYLSLDKYHDILFSSLFTEANPRGACIELMNIITKSSIGRDSDKSLSNFDILTHEDLDHHPELLLAITLIFYHYPLPVKKLLHVNTVTNECTPQVIHTLFERIARKKTIKSSFYGITLYYLGLCAQDGYGCRKDHEQADKLFEKSYTVLINVRDDESTFMTKIRTYYRALLRLRGYGAMGRAKQEACEILKEINAPPRYHSSRTNQNYPIKMAYGLLIKLTTWRIKRALCPCMLDQTSLPDNLDWVIQ